MEDNVSNPPRDMEGLLQKFILILRWFVGTEWIVTPKDLLFWIPHYLLHELPVVSKNTIDTETV